MLRNREPALRIQFMLARQLRQIWRAKELRRRAPHAATSPPRVGINPYFLDDVLVPARRMSRAALERAFERLYQADLALKTSRVEPELALVAPGPDASPRTPPGSASSRFFAAARP